MLRRLMLLLVTEPKAGCLGFQLWGLFCFFSLLGGGGKEEFCLDSGAQGVGVGLVFFSAPLLFILWDM